MEEGEEDESLVETFTCMHAHFYREHLVTAFGECLSPSGNLSRQLQMVCNTMHQMNVPLLLAGDVLPTGKPNFQLKGVITAQFFMSPSTRVSALSNA